VVAFTGMRTVALDLVTTLKSSFTTNLSSDLRLQADSIQQRLLFLRSICEGEQMLAALSRIQAFPHSILIRQASREDITRSIPQSGSLLMGKGERLAVPATHRMYKRIKSLPRTISNSIARETIDTAENRFVRFVITSIAEFLSRAEMILRSNRNSDRSLGQWVQDASKGFREIASHSFFRGIGALQIVPIGSPVIQRKHGYKQVLDVWLRFNSANQLSWDALSEVFSAGQRDAALLYEYWCFFVIRDAILAAFDLQFEDLSEVIRLSDDRLTITLKYGEEAVINGTFLYSGVLFGIRFCFQSSFGPKSQTIQENYIKSNSASGTWSKRMEPDFTLSIWCFEGSVNDGGEAHAREAGKHAYLHFDAKYRVVLGTSSVPSEDSHQKLRAKSDDLDKMHAYLNSINGTVGSYAIYPGEITEFFCMSESVLPSVGYIGIRPSDDGKGKEHLRQHLLNVMGALYDEWFPKSEGAADCHDGFA
jgi:predicted component of viral defense system (DUF524 family)